jgi:transcriptional regulator with XRE-family HTH domain
MLAERCELLGAPAINRDVITNLENGRRATVTVDELFVLAFALGVAPTHLLADPEDTGHTAVTEKIKVSSRPMRAWLASRASLSGQDPRKFAGQAVPWLEDLPVIDEEAVSSWRRLDEITRTLLPPIEDDEEAEELIRALSRTPEENASAAEAKDKK